MRQGCAFFTRLCACSHDLTGYNDVRADTFVLRQASLLRGLFLLASALSTRLQPRPPVIILALSHVACCSSVLAVSAAAAVQPFNGEALLLNETLCLSQTRLHGSTSSRPLAQNQVMLLLPAIGAVVRVMALITIL